MAGLREARQGAPAGAQSMVRTARVVQVTRRLPSSPPGVPSCQATPARANLVEGP